MPDIKTAMQHALAKTATDWAADDEAHNKIAPMQATTTTPKETIVQKEKTYHTVTNNVTRATFNYIRENPGMTRLGITTALESVGFKPGSVTSLIGQMLKHRLVRDENGGLHANQKEYTPLKAPTPDYGHTNRRKYVRRTLPAPAAVQPSPETVEAVQINSAWDADTLLNNLSIKQARALYDELRKIFGG